MATAAGVRSGVEASNLMVSWFDGSRFVWWLRALALVTAGVVGVSLSAPVASAEPDQAKIAVESADAAQRPGEGVLSAADEVSARVSARASGARVLVESATTVSSKTWANPDGSMTVEEVGVPVRFIDSGGSWREIDTSLKADTKGSVMVAASPLGVSMTGTYPFWWTRDLAA